MDWVVNFFGMIGEAILKFVHLFVYSANAYHAAADQAEARQIMLDDMTARYTAACEELEDRRKEMAVNRETLKEVSARLEQLQAQVMREGEYKRVDAEYLRATQEQLSEEFGMHPVFGFPRSPGFPGSMCVTSKVHQDPDDPNKLVTAIYGRIILDDATTRKINEAPHLYDKTLAVLDFLNRYGGAERIMVELVQNGAVSMTLGYREATTTYELFYEIAAYNQAPEAVLVFDSADGHATIQKPASSQE